MTTVTFASDQRRAVGLQYVYLKQTWDASWTLYYDTYCTEATWCLSPTMPTATLVRDYGYVKGLATNSYTTTYPLDVTGWYVKIVMETDTQLGTSNTWYGVVGSIEDEHKGLVKFPGSGPDVPLLATGTQVISCYGLEKLLDTEFIAESWVDTGNATPLVVQLPITFNHGGRPNRNDRQMLPWNTWTFEGQSLNPGTTLRPTAQWWSTYYIVDYLLSWATPKESFRTRFPRVPFYIHPFDWDLLPHLDRPQIEQEGQTVWAIINRLIDRRRLRSTYLQVYESVTPNAVYLRVVPWNRLEIDTGVSDADVLLPNRNPISLIYDQSQNTSASLRTTRVQRYDRIIVRGARRTSTASFVVDTSYLNPAWSTAEETAYEAAARGVGGYAGWDTLTKMQRNAEVRNAAELSAVYSWFKLTDGWTFNTLGVETSIVSPVFVQADGLTVESQYIHDVVWEPNLPLYELVDYSGTKIRDGTQADPPLFVYQQPKVFFKIPTDARWIAGDSISTLMESTGDATVDGKNLRWSAFVRTQPETRTLEVRVSGEQQHVIADTDFTPLADDRDLGDFDYRSKKMCITATLRDNRYAEGKWPDDDGRGDATTIDAKFGFVIYAGDAYRQDYVVTGTILDVETDGTLIGTTAPGYVRDDTDLLQVLARITYDWWNQERVVLSLATTQLTSAIQPGYLIETVGDSTVFGNSHYQQVDTVVSEVRILWPKLEGNQMGTPVMEFVTGAGELDPLTLVPRGPNILTRAKARIAR